MKLGNAFRGKGVIAPLGNTWFLNVISNRWPTRTQMLDDVDELDCKFRYMNHGINKNYSSHPIVVLRRDMQGISATHGETKDEN